MCFSDFKSMDHKTNVRMSDEKSKTCSFLYVLFVYTDGCGAPCVTQRAVLTLRRAQQNRATGRTCPVTGSSV
jgi:hypothetical protein